MSNITFKRISNIIEAELVWKALSPRQFVFDDWNFRYGYYKYFQYPLFFYAAYDDDELVGLLPLMWDEEKQYLDFFAGFGYMENNSIFLKPGYEDLYHELLKQIDRPALLEYMRTPTEEGTGAQVHDNNYFIDLKGMTSYHDFIDTYFSTDKKNNILSQFKKLEEKRLTIKEGTLEDLDILFYWSKIRFGETSSFYTRPYFEKYIRFIASHFDSKIITVSLDGKIEGVGLVILYNNVCHGINSGYNPDISNLGKYLTFLKIDAGIKAGKEIYDAGTGAFGWKEDFHLLKNPQYKIDLRQPAFLWNI